MLHLVVQQADLLTANASSKEVEFVLNRGRHSSVATSLLSFLAQKCVGVAEHELPLAAISWRGEAFEKGDHREHPSVGAYVYFVQPVHLILQRDHFSLAPLALTQLPYAHAQSFIEVLNQHFNAANLYFSVGHSGMWYLHAQQDLQIKTVSPYLAIHQNVQGFQPSGSGAQAWRSILNEVQMLLFEHPLNQARERQGLVAINSLWCWGGGVIHDGMSITPPFSFATGLPFLTGLGQLMGQHPCSDNPTDTNGQLAEGCWVPTVACSAHMLDWVKTGKRLVDSRQLKGMALHLDLGANVHTVEYGRFDRWKWWRSSPLRNQAAI